MDLYVHSTMGIDSSKVGRGQWAHDLDKNYFKVEWWNPKSKGSKDQRSLEISEGQMNSWVIFSWFYPLNGCYQYFQVWFYWNNYISSYGIKHMPTTFIRVLKKRGRDNPFHFQKWKGHVLLVPHHLLTPMHSMEGGRGLPLRHAIIFSPLSF